VLAVVPALVAVVLAGLITVGLTRLTAVSAAEHELRQSIEGFSRVAPSLVAVNATERRRIVEAVLHAENADLVTVRPGADVTGGDPVLSVLPPAKLATLRDGATVSGRAVVEGHDVVYAARLVGGQLSPRGGGLVVVARRAAPRLGVLPGGGGSRLFLATGVALAVAVVLGMIMGRRLARPLVAVTHAASAVASGHYGQRVSTDVGGEIGALAAGFNAMSDQLDAARRRERDFVVDISHDLRTPLTSIRGYAEGILDGTITGDEARGRAAAVIDSEARRLERLVDDLLSLERLDAGQFTFAMEDVPVAAFLADIVERHRPSFSQAGVRLELHAPIDAFVRADPDRLGQAVGNLMDNALRHAPRESTVRVDATVAGPSVDLSVSDEGDGIDAADLPHVFERRYVSARSRAAGASGTGLGLAIAARIAAALGGRVSVTSGPGAGSRFTVHLPLTS